MTEQNAAVFGFWVAYVALPFAGSLRAFFPLCCWLNLSRMETKVLGWNSLYAQAGLDLSFCLSVLSAGITGMPPTSD